jgi:hypothetical protein
MVCVCHPRRTTVSHRRPPPGANTRKQPISAKSAIPLHAVYLMPDCALPSQLAIPKARKKDLQSFRQVYRICVMPCHSLARMQAAV